EKVLPVWRVENDAQLPIAVEYPIVAQLPAAYRAQQSLELIDGDDSGGRIVNRWRQRLEGDINNDAKVKGGILFDGALAPKCHLATQKTIVYSGNSGAAQMKQLVARRDEITDPWYQFDNRIRFFRFFDQRIKINGNHDR